jgi:hypothetical protein
VLLAGCDRFVSSYSRTSKAPDPRAVANQGQTEVNQQRVQGQAQKSDRERFVQKMGGTNMIEAMKQALEFFESGNFVYPTKIATDLRQAIAGLESQEPVAWMKPDVLCDRACMYLCTKGFTQFPECATIHPPQRTWVGLTDEDAEEVWQSVQASDFHDCVKPFAQGIEAKLKEKNNA